MAACVWMFIVRLLVDEHTIRKTFLEGKRFLPE